jgi:hypothetical protein
MHEEIRLSRDDNRASIAAREVGSIVAGIARRPTRGQLFREAEAYQTELLHEIRCARYLRGGLVERWGDRLWAIRLAAPRAGERLQELLDEVDRYREEGIYRYDFGCWDRSSVDLLKLELESIARRLFILMDLRERALEQRCPAGCRGAQFDDPLAA